MIKACDAYVAWKAQFNFNYTVKCRSLCYHGLFKYSMFSAPGGIIGNFYHFWLRSERSWVRSLLGSPCFIIEQDTFTSQKVLVIPRNRWLRPDMTEKLLTWTQSLNPNKQKPNIYVRFLDSYMYYNCASLWEKSVFMVSDEVRHKPGCTATDDG